MIQSVLFHISQATNQSENLDSLLSIIHKQLGQLINTKNFFVALYDESLDGYTFPFMVDEYQKYNAGTVEEMKHSLQIIQSLLGLQTQFIRDPKDLGLIKESQDRVRSIALVHENLYQSPNLADIDFAEYIRNLVYALYRSYKVNMDQIQLDIKIKDIKFPVDRAVPCGLIINELLTNALKYAFPPEFNRKGLIEIIMKRSSKNEVELIFSDNGIGIPDDKVDKGTESLGLTLVKLLAEKQLKGKIKVDYKKGTKYTMILNLLA